MGLLSSIFGQGLKPHSHTLLARLQMLKVAQKWCQRGGTVGCKRWSGLDICAKFRFSFPVDLMIHQFWICGLLNWNHWSQSDAPPLTAWNLEPRFLDASFEEIDDNNVH